MLKKFLLTRRRALRLIGQALLGLGTAIGLAPRRSTALATSMSQPSLKQQGLAKGVMYGSSVRRVDLEGDANLAASVYRECQLIVPEWELKWIAGSSTLRPDLGIYNFDDADWAVNFARGRGQRVHGHTLIWHLSLPDWFNRVTDPQVAQQVLGSHIQTVMGRYRGEIFSWDVVNEVIEPNDGRDDYLRDSPWLRLLGPAYIDLAFKIAAQTDPSALLVLNENGVEYDTLEHDQKRAGVLQLIKQLQTQGSPIGALGIQAHLDATEKRFNAQKFRQFLADVARLGLKIMITELDVNDQNLVADPAQRDLQVAAIYTEFLAVVLSEPAVISIVTWGLSDPYSWLLGVVPRDDLLPLRPLPLDENMQRKPAWQAIANAFDQMPMPS
jgi:endo-1,4-beta-xylanase